MVNIRLHRDQVSIQLSQWLLVKMVTTLRMGSICLLRCRMVNSSTCLLRPRCLLCLLPLIQWLHSWFHKFRTGLRLHSKCSIWMDSISCQCLRYLIWFSCLNRLVYFRGFWILLLQRRLPRLSQWKPPVRSLHSALQKQSRHRKRLQPFLFRRHLKTTMTIRFRPFISRPRISPNSYHISILLFAL